ncbi:LysR family transcriptional regulator [Parachitinimonas caeni]|uniref:LysR family transcriptional regulator n=1 Tax=Parachitinimonas caeni TaxID=3031301 RepID=A0ABT7E3Q5_9NEIS|nr:LysR family transcriptional regulator [Parachitinimonas caeni]MDK2125963.1 LysR family transcriptional regulator [Parachitinimonas caeni]
MHSINDLNDLRYVEAVVQAGSLSGAARKLGVNHATVFRRINQLEAELGVRLFERDDGRYQATAAGEELAQAGTLISEAAAQALLKVAGRDLRPSGSVRITTTDSLARGLLNPILVQCRLQYPQIQLQLHIDNAMANLSKRDADIAIRPAPSPPEHLIGKCIGELAFAVYGARPYLAQCPDTPFAQHAWIALDDSHGRHRTLRWLEQMVALDSVGYRINSFGGIRDACSAGLGLAVLPCFLAEAEAGLQRVGAPLPDCMSELWLLTHPDLRDTLRVKVIYQLLLQALLQKRDILRGI